LNRDTESKIDESNILKSGYGLISQRISRDRSISIPSKGLYSYLSSMAGSEGICHPSRDLIIYELNINKNSFTKYLNELKRNGYIKVHQQREKRGKVCSNVYEIVFDINYIEKAKQENLCMKKSDTDLKEEIDRSEESAKIMDSSVYGKIDKNIKNIVENTTTIENTSTVEHTTTLENTMAVKNEENKLKNPYTKIPCTDLPYTVKEDSNSNSININNKPYLYLSDSAVDNNEDCEYFKDFKSLYEKNLGFAYPIIDEWLLEKSKEIDILLFKRAIAICSEKSTMELAYLKGILKKWKSKNICSYNQLEAYEGRGKSINKSSKTESNSTEAKSSRRSKKTDFHNFEETFTKYSEDELGEIIRKSQKSKFG
jgi:DnaD/phage-associated family protein